MELNYNHLHTLLHRAIHLFPYWKRNSRQIFKSSKSVTGSGTTGVGQLSFAEVSGGTSWQAVKTSTFTAAAGEGYFVNTTSGVITMNLPAGS